MNENEMPKNAESSRRWIFIGGENRTHPVMEEGACFVEIPDRRFSWPEWDGKSDVSTGEEAETIPGWEVAGIAQLEADKRGRAVVDKINRPTGERFCVLWAADGQRFRIVQELSVTELPTEATAAHRKTLAGESVEPQGQTDIQTIATAVAVAVLREQDKASLLKREEEKKQREQRRAKDTRPRWGAEEQRLYDGKISDLIGAGKTNRQIADEIPKWAEGNSNLRPFKTPSNSALQKWAAILRGKRKKRKRME